MRGAEELANDLHHALELVEAERDEAIRERDEAQAVIDAVRAVRDWAAGRKRQHYDRWNETDDRSEADQAGVYALVLARFDGVDGL